MFSFDSEDEDAPVEPWFSLIRNLSCDQIQSLYTIFKEKVLRGKLTKTNECTGLTKEEFVNAIDEVFGKKLVITVYLNNTLKSRYFS